MSESAQPRSYVQQDLRNRSFKGQILNAADFSGADLRGCTFNNAQLVGANFERARMGRSLRQRVIWVGSAIATFLLVGHAVSNLVFGSLGQTPADKAWTYVLVLVGVSGLAGALAGVKAWLKQPFNQIAEILAGVAAGAVVGFFYAGVLAGKDPRWAIGGAVLGGVALGVLGLSTWRWRWRRLLSAIVLRLTVALTAYGFAFLVGATALTMLNVGYLWAGFILGLLSLLYLWFTWQGLVDTVQTIRQAPGTTFCNANLTDARFSAVSVHQADFSGAVGRTF
ncbi:MAG: pentapeptide repeat-containing protein [Leptolyngbyaceae cyanobacterium bins.302]|nr:pentapeptide repeat-containing protein [Leptolyngbyaceae cyanobacterium bins.302]